MQLRFDARIGRQSEHSLINFVWLLNLRWAAALGQLGTILSTEIFFGVPLPMFPLLMILVFEAVTNLVFTVWLRVVQGRGGWGAEAVPTAHALMGSIMVLDLLLLTALLYATGGPSNPFCLFYLVNVLLASLLLRPSWGWALAGLGVLCFAFLFFAHEPLPGLPPFWGSSLPAGALHEAWRLYLLGLLVAFAVLSITLLYFFTRLRNELGELEVELDRAMAQRERSRRLEAMATLAAGAAHELSTPLSTIAVVAKELERDLLAGPDLEHATEDARLIRQEVQRCRSILDQMSSDAGESAGEGLQVTTVEALFAEVTDGVRAAERVDCEVDVRISGVHLVLPRTAVVQALRNLIHNGLDASEPGGRVQFFAEKDEGAVLVVVRDEGSGMDPDTLERAGSPFFTTKEVGQGMGLGLFLTQSVFDRLGARFELESEPGIGTTARVWFRLEAGGDPAQTERARGPEVETMDGKAR